MTVTVTDDDGVPMADTMYVYVDESNVPNTSTDGSKSRGPTDPAPSPSVGGGGGGGSVGGGHAMALDSIAADSNDNKYLVNRDGGDFVFHTRDGETVIISNERFSQMADEDGRVDWEKAEKEFLDEGVTEGDVDDSMDEGNCGGFTCTTVSDRSGEDDDYSDYDIDSGDLGYNANINVDVDADTPGIGATLSRV